MRRRLALLLACFLVGAGCESIGGLSGAGDDPDAAVTPDDATMASADAGPEAAMTTDAFVTSDADATAPVEASTSPCVDAGPTTYFCTDFEEATPLGKWDMAQIKGGYGQISIVSGAGLGGSKAFRALATDASTDRTVALWKAIGNTPSALAKYTASFSFLIKKKEIDYGVFGIVGFVTNSVMNEYYGLARYPNDKLDQSDPPASTSGIAVDGTPNVWHSCTIELVRVGAGPSFNGKLTVDTVVVDDFRTVSSAGANSIELRLGYLFTSADPGEAEVLFDDVVVTRE